MPEGGGGAGPLAAQISQEFKFWTSMEERIFLVLLYLVEKFLFNLPIIVSHIIDLFAVVLVLLTFQEKA